MTATDSDSDTNDSIIVVEPGPSSSSTRRSVSNPYYNQKSNDLKNDDDSDEEDDSDDSDDDDDDDSFDDDTNESDGETQTEDSSKPADESIPAEDALIVALRQAKEQKERNAPPDITFRRSNVADISFHPQNDLIAVADMDGQITLFEYSNEKNVAKKKLQIHKKTVRSMEFDSSGRHLYSGSKDRSFKITDLETGQIKLKVSKAHESPLNRVRPVNEFICATGDEDGMVKLWDPRSGQSVLECDDFTDIVKDLYVDKDCRLMIAASGEGTIMSYNVRGKKSDVQSEFYEGEMNCLAVVHHDSKLVCGCGDSRLYMYNWDQFGYHSADFPGHPDSVNDMVAVTDNVVITGCEDGTIRAVHLYPHRFLGAVGHHEGNFPIERLDVSSTGEFVASVSHDQKVKFWSIAYLENIDYNKTKKPFFNRMKHKIRRKDFKMLTAKEQEHQLPSSNRGNSKDFFGDL
ncbi:WD repeat-containing protein 55 homolog [Tigriopus californicus]|uniref:WD repeat-containing protein 55 homolog n=1 Tax=Tigriopus californicus TaxID=6832 RepID=UPI0027D9E619|nr:WD repeat-containing protein 55 homolog [Tigriopus californicus]